jgi:hypothetical protein
MIHSKGLTMHLPSLPRLRRSLAAGLLLLGAVGAQLVATTDAHAAGGYIHQSCATGTDLGDAYGGWESGMYSIIGNGNAGQCPGGGLHSEMYPGAMIPFGAVVGWTYTAPANTNITRFNVSYAGWTKPFDGVSRGVIQALNGRGSIGLTYTDNGADPSHQRVLDWTGLADSSVSVRTLCDGPNGQPGCNGSTAWSSFYYPKIYLADDSLPVVGATSGSITSDPALKGNESLSYAATDQGGGVARIRLYVDGSLSGIDHVIDDFNGHCQVQSTEGGTWVFSFPKPCPSSVNTIETIDTTAISDGSHTLTAKVVDASQREATLWTETKVVANHPPVNVSAPAYVSAQRAAQPRVGDELAMPNNGTWAGPNITYAAAWQQCDASGTSCVQIPGAANLSYTSTAGDIGRRLRYSVTATNPADSVTVTSPLSGIVTAQENSTTAPVTKPTDGTNGSNGANGSNGTGGAGTIVVPGLGTTTTTSQTVHTFIGRVAGEASGATCPEDRASLVLEHVKGGHLKLGYGKAGTAQLLLTCSTTGKAIADAKLQIATQTGRSAVVASDVTTDGVGHAVLRLAKGASRGITVGYRMYADDPIARATTTLKVLVDSRLTLTANRTVLRNGRAVALRGQLAGGNIPSRGVTLAVEWKDGRRWRPFAQVKTDRRGTVRYAYQFTRTTRRIGYQLRMQVIKGQVDYPFVATASKSIKVTVAP